MADDVQRPRASPSIDSAQAEAAEDAETRATIRELKQSSISDQLSNEAEGAKPDKDRAQDSAVGVTEAQEHEPKENVSLPPKKRPHDQLDGNQGPQDDDATSTASAELAKNRTVRHEPEKKRYREKESSDSKQESSLLEAMEEKKNQDQHGTSPAPGKKIFGDGSSTLFTGSAFGRLASESSGFASLGSFQGRGFSSVKPKSSSFASTISTLGSEGKPTVTDNMPPAVVPKLTFGGSSGASPFAGLSSQSSGFGGIGFGLPSTILGKKPLSSFTPSGTKVLQCDKGVRPFGAPDSDESEATEEGEDDADSEGQPNDKLRRASPEKDSEDKRKPKLQKIEVDDGEAGEITVLSVRAKVFSLDKQMGWKERGAGMLKINVPHACVEFDDSGAVIPGSFDASCLEIDEKSVNENDQSPKVARLILRQDQTHRVILNTAILPAMEFQEKASLKSVGILFTALEGNEAKPISITIRMSAANSKLFFNEIHAIQRELRGS